LERRLAAILAADVAGYSALVGRQLSVRYVLEIAPIFRVSAHIAFIRNHIGSFF